MRQFVPTLITSKLRLYHARNAAEKQQVAGTHMLQVNRNSQIKHRKN